MACVQISSLHFIHILNIYRTYKYKNDNLLLFKCILLRKEVSVHRRLKTVAVGLLMKLFQTRNYGGV